MSSEKAASMEPEKRSSLVVEGRDGGTVLRLADELAALAAERLN